jgi:phosphate transport system ATP-binding protein
MIKLRTENFNLFFGESHVLKNINVSFSENRVTSIMGPSGCGKTTLIRSINRLNDLVYNLRTQGAIYLEDFNLYDKKTNVTEVRRKIGQVFQDPNPFPKSIYDNVAFGLRINGKFPKNEIKSIVEKSLKESYLWDEVKDKLHKPALELSGGQQQRLCIARAIAVKPNILMMDEPTSALDPKGANRIEELILKLKEEYSIIMITHNIQQAERIADDVVFMYLGEVIESGRRKKVFQNPQKDLTREYISGQFG